MKRARSWTVTNDVYGYDLFLRVGGSAVAANRWVDKLLGTDSECNEEDEASTAAVTFTSESNTSHAIWFRDKPDAGTVAHEAVHAVYHVFRNIGIGELSSENEEAFAYLTDWTVRQIWSRIKG